MDTGEPTPTHTDIRPMFMPTDPRFLTLMQWLSPAFPTGAFAYSHGIESAIADGWITDAESLEDWLQDCLTHGSGRADATWIRLAFEAEDPKLIDLEARAFISSHERLREAERQGAAFINIVNDVWDISLSGFLLPVALGHAARHVRLDIDATVAFYLHSFVSNLVSAAQRLAPIGQTAGQRVIANLMPLCLEVANDTKGASVEDVFGNAFRSDISAMRHETLQPRLFQS